MRKLVKVTCAIIEKGDSVLVVQRGENMSLPLKWEFPGGKLEANESEEECIIREIQEELNLEILPIQKLTHTFYNYPTVSIELIPFIAKELGGDIFLTEHFAYKYLPKSELTNLDWAEADIEILNNYLSYD